jgi:hypothetical protein
VTRRPQEIEHDGGREVLASLTVRVWRLHRETPGVIATVPILRGVWGAALHAVSERVYQDLFLGGASRVPRYWLRPAPPRPGRRPLSSGASSGGVSRMASWPPGTHGTGLAARGWGQSGGRSSSRNLCPWQGMARLCGHRSTSQVSHWRASRGPADTALPAGCSFPPRSD